MNYITSIEFARKNDISPRMAAYYCQKGQIPGVIKKGKTWLIPLGAKKPLDKRQKIIKEPVESIISAVDGDINQIDIRKAADRYYIQELNDFIGVTREGIRYCERLGLIRPMRELTNNYRTFNGFDVFRLMAIDFYRKRGFSNPEIKDFFQLTQPESFLTVFDAKKNKLELKIRQYQEMLAKLEETKEYINNLATTYNIFSVKQLPEFEVKNNFSSFSDFYDYQEKVFASKDFSNQDILSNLVRTLYFDETGYTGSQMSIVELVNNTFSAQSCIHIKVSADNNDEKLPEKMLLNCNEWAKEQQLSLQGEVRIFIRLVIFGEIEHNYYDVYIPIKND